MSPQVDVWQQKVEQKLKDLSLTGSWCAYKNRWTSGFDVVTYDRILHADSNMDINALNVAGMVRIVKPKSEVQKSKSQSKDLG